MPLHPENPNLAPHVLAPDLDGSGARPRTSLGVVPLRLDANVEVKAIGEVYGLEHRIHGEGFEALLFLDQRNQRIRVLDYRAANLHAMIMQIRSLAEANGFDKIIAMASANDWLAFLRHGYVLEAVIRYFHQGADAYVVSKFRSQARLASSSLMSEILLIEEIMASPPKSDAGALPNDCSLRLARRDDIPRLLELYRGIFVSYPSPLVHESYLRAIFAADSLFAVCVRGNEVVAAASAEFQPRARAAELTDCATLPELRGLGIMSALLRFLEVELVRREYLSAYTMARARSVGMNRVFYSLGYEFMGRLVNNCDIQGSFEDMNIWVRSLRPTDGEAPGAPDARAARQEA
jgi:putative beta-lysine N-acetyltransferase